MKIIERIYLVLKKIHFFNCKPLYLKRMKKLRFGAIVMPEEKKVTPLVSIESWGG